MLQRSVTLMRRLLCRRPKVSIRGVTISIVVRVGRTSRSAHGLPPAPGQPGGWPRTRRSAVLDCLIYSRHDQVVLGPVGLRCAVDRLYPESEPTRRGAATRFR